MKAESETNARLKEARKTLAATLAVLEKTTGKRRGSCPPRA